MTLIYDGDCPLCSAYVTRMRLAESAGSLELLDARQHPELVRRLGQQGYSLNEGMLVVVGERYYHGAAAVQVLALMSSRTDWFNRLNYWQPTRYWFQVAACCSGCSDGSRLAPNNQPNLEKSS